MYDSNFQTKINRAGNFKLRRAVERLRDGLFDPLGIKLLTMGEAKLNQAFDRGVKILDKGKSSHLCICGAYGQGKSHSLNYIKQRALDQNFVVSYINLDPREIPFHKFKDVYRELMERINFPNQETFVNVWKTSVTEWLSLPENRKKTCADLIPNNIPHRFKAILTAMAQKNISIPNGKKKLKKHAGFKPREFPWVLKNALMGKEFPAWRLRPAFYYRQVSFYKKHSLICKSDNQYLDMVQGMAELFRKIGFKGWVILFDEGESITQARITSRSKSYKLLNKIFSTKNDAGGFYPVFAFTHDFFTQVADEDYDRVKIKTKINNSVQSQEEIPYFDKNYNAAWEKINIHNLQNLSSKEWKLLTKKLIFLHAGAYNWQPSATVLEKEMNRELSKYGSTEARLKLKLLVNHLDIVHQKQVLQGS